MEPTDTHYEKAMHLGMRLYMSMIEREIIETAIIEAHGNRSDAAEDLHLMRTTLVMKLRKHKLIDKYPSPQDRKLQGIQNQQAT